MQNELYLISDLEFRHKNHKILLLKKNKKWKIECMRLIFIMIQYLQYEVEQYQVIM